MRCLFVWLMGVALTLPFVYATDDAFAQCEILAREQRQYRCFGEIAGKSGDWEEARKRLQKIIAEEPENAEAWWSLGYIREGLFRHDAGEAYLMAAEQFQSRQNFAGEAQVRLYLQSWYWGRGELEQALETLGHATRAAENAQDELLLAQSGVAHADVAGKLGRYDESEQLLLNVEPLLSKAPVWLQALWASTRATNLWSLHDPVGASKMYRRAAELRHEQGSYYLEAFDRLALAQAAEIGDRAMAYAEALRVAKLANNKSVIANVELAMGRGDPNVEAGRKQMKDAFARILALKKPLATHSAAQTLAVHYARQEPTSKSASMLWYERALAAAMAAGSERAVASILATRNHDLWRFAVDDLEARAHALRDGYETLDAIESVRDLQLDSLVRARSFSAWRLTYDRLIGRVLSPRMAGSAVDYSAAFAIMERLRARILLDEMDAARVWEDPMPPSFSKRDSLLREIARARSGMQPEASNESQLENSALHLARLRREERDLRGQLVQENPKFGMLRGSFLAGLESVQAALDSSEAILSYQLGEWEDEAEFAGGSWLLVLTRDSVEAFPLQVDASLLDALDSYRVIAASRMKVPEAASIRIYDALLRTAIETLPDSIHKLILIPDKELHRTPFAGLKSAINAPTLGTEYELSRSPSATLWLRWRLEKPRRASRSLLAFAGPDMEGQASANELAISHGELPRLPFAIREGRSATKILGRDAKLLLGASATEAALKSAALTDYAVLHVATHAQIDPRRPERSAILLTTSEDQSEDGRLHIDEIANLQFGDSMIVLSACQSATGAVLESEGVMNLARGFFVAGARSVIGSLWPVRDDEAALFFQEFYRQLDEGASVGLAFQMAQSNRQASGAPMAAWAGMILIGDAQLQPVSSRESSPWLGYGIRGSGVILVLAVLIFAVVRRRSQR